ncbi:MAG: trypsin-like peptidase domain-containing protein [Anaerolineae bacterium]|jgi:S1-C subfamily serine protease|nr:trypsin-like peptidase domain-containing protein [Anaerolineae bacterium]
MEPTVLSQARQVYSQALPQLFGRQNVVACGLGYKIRGTEQTQELSLIVSVVRKLPKEELSSKDLVPQTLDGLPTDVVETGYIRAQGIDPKGRQRPAMPGISLGHYQITAGTFGLLVQRGDETFILSNNHVLANANNAQAGDPILQPGPLDGGTAADQIATLAEFVPLDFGEQPGQCQIATTVAELLNTLAGLIGSSHRLQAVQQSLNTNLMDVALARPDTPDLVVPALLELGTPTGVAVPHLGEVVQKVGRTTGLTTGAVQQIDVTVDVDYNGRTARFTNQVIASGMSSPGDSGSAILNMDKKVVGLLFAGSGQITIFTPIQQIINHFGVELPGS